jgi:hypothetical protein
MAKKRQARRCSAHRTDGRACGAYAVTGGTVCAAHGGQASQIKVAAARRQAEDQAAAALERWHPRTGMARRLTCSASWPRSSARLPRFAGSLLTSLAG